ncbi:MAG: DUF1844 domain-containing protein [Actinobacteria bacterium]|nr:DUF1844 domain-containing protein [Actinomycetota bacterium]
MDEQEKMGLEPEEVEMLARFQDELRRMTVGDHLATMLQSLATLALRKMGVTPETGSERDLDQAHLAIEAFRVLVPVMESSRPAAEMQAHRRVLSELQMAYVGALQPTEQAAGTEPSIETTSEDDQEGE